MRKPPNQRKPDWVAKESFQDIQKRKTGYSFLWIGAIPTAVGLFALNEGIGLLDWSRTYLDEEAVLHGTLLGAFGLILIGVGLTKCAQKKLGCLPLLLVGLPVFICWVHRVNLVKTKAERTEGRAEVFMRFQKLCVRGTGVGNGAAFVPGATPRILQFRRGAGLDAKWTPNYNTPPEWQRGSTGDIALVACVETTTNLLESCSFSSGSTRFNLSREQYVTTLTLRAAQSGEAILTEEWTGSEPRNCPKSATITSKSIRGTLTPRETLYQRVNTFVKTGR
jgi:hypothetical protein